MKPDNYLWVVGEIEKMLRVYAGVRAKSAKSKLQRQKPVAGTKVRSLGLDYFEEALVANVGRQWLRQKGVLALDYVYVGWIYWRRYKLDKQVCWFYFCCTVVVFVKVCCCLKNINNWFWLIISRLNRIYYILNSLEDFLDLKLIFFNYIVYIWL